MTQRVYMTKEGFIAHVNRERKANKNKWVTVIETVDGKIVEYKAFGTWVQILRIEGCEYKLSSNMDISVTEFLSFLRSSLDRYL